MTPKRPHATIAPMLAAAFLLLVPLAGCQPATTNPETPAAVPEYSIAQFMGNTALSGLSFSPDGQKLLVSSDASGIFNLYAFPVDGGEPTRLTSADDARFAIGYFPDGKRFLATGDQGGNELDHLFAYAADGTVTDLTPGDGHKAVFYGWTPDKSAFFFGTNERDKRYFDVYEMSSTDFERTPLYTDNEGLQVADVSSDLRYIAFTKAISTSDSDVYLLDRTTGEMHNLTDHDSFEANQAITFDPAAKTLLYVTDRNDEFSYLVAYDLATGETKQLVHPAWDVVGAHYSTSGDHLSVWINNDARTEVQVYNSADMSRVELPELPEAEITSVEFSPDESRIAFYASTARSPRDLYVSELGGGPDDAGGVHQISHTLNPEIDPNNLVAPEVVRFASYDGVEIPGLLYRPHQASADHKVPALVWIHGGPGGQSRIGYSESLQFLVNHGYAVYAINNRGSSGYGKTFFRMDDRKHGEADLDDVVAAKGMLIDTGWIEPAKIGVLGGSYGGYLTLAAITFRPEEFAVGVDLFGISNWVRTLESIPPWWESFRDALYQEMGDPAQDGERLRRISPLFHADQIRRPLMVLQGANDPRVLKVESDEIVAAAKAHGVPVEYLVFDDEGHGFVNKANRQEAYEKILEFLDTYLAGDGANHGAADGAAPADSAAPGQETAAPAGEKAA